MPDPIVEQIAQNIVTTLQGVTTGAGYNQTLTVERRKPRDNRERDNLAIVFQADTEQVANTPQQRSTWLQRFGVMLFAIESESSSTAIETRLNRLRSDVEKALMVDPFRNSLAVDTIIQEPELVSDAAGQWEAVIVYFDVHYRTAIDDPYSTT